MTQETLILTGMSGAGRSTVAHALEDLGWYVVDNLPIFAHRFPIKTFKSATGYVTTCTSKMQKGERSFNLRPPNWKKSRPISRRGST